MENFAIFLIGRGVSLGFAAAALPGPLQAYLLNTALTQGWRRSLFVVVSPLIVDIPIILAVLLALNTMEAVMPNIADIMQVVGGVFVLYLAWGALQDYRNNVSLTDPEAPATQQTARGTFTRALILNAVSPGPYLFWTTVNGPLLQQALERSAGHGVVFLLAFYVTFLSGFMVMAALVSALRTLNDRLTRGLILAAAVLLAGIGLWLIVGGVWTLTGL